MKKALLLLVVAIFFVGCGDNLVPKPGGGLIDPNNSGKLALSIAAGDPIVIEAKSSRAAGVDLSTFGIDVKNTKGDNVGSYSYSQMSGEIEYNAGDYVMEAKNDGVSKGAAWDKPLYAGSKPFKVAVGETTVVDLLCELKSTGVQIEYLPSLLDKCKNISVSLVNSAGGVLLDNPAEARRTGWFAVSSGGIEIKVTATDKTTDAPISFSQPITNPKAKELRKLKLDIKTSGSSIVTIKVDETIVSKDVTVKIPTDEDIIDNGGDNGSWEEGEDPVVPPTDGVPTIVGASHEGAPFDIEQLVIIDRAIVPNVLDVMISSTATGGIQSLFLEINSVLLTPMLADMFGLVGQIDLANPPTGADAPGWVGLFSDPSIGIIPADPIRGKSEHLFSVGALMGMLGGIVDTEGGVEHKFVLKVVDAKGATTKTLTLMLSPKK